MSLVFRQAQGDISVGSLVISEGAAFSGVAEMNKHKPMEAYPKGTTDKQRDD